MFTLQDERITDTATHKRLKACESWLKARLTKLLSTVKIPSSSQRISVVYGSFIQGPGAKGTDFRLHLALALVSMTLHEVHATGADQGESLRRCGMADRGYNHPNQSECFKVLMERPRRRALQTLPSEAASWLKLSDKLELSASVI
ncbi:hypothetical protein [Methylobacter svalbardensis]|uniref:hypothetical protein n=1 Tax=Methylobacter svalbardensis TaxID=3080016 RepID=UPI0030EC013B